jgi:hypothetical protein
MPYLDAYPIREVDILLISQYVESPFLCHFPLSRDPDALQPVLNTADGSESGSVTRLRSTILERWTSFRLSSVAQSI